MNRNEKRLLRSAVNAVAHHSRNAWWELKRQIWEAGYAAYCRAAGAFDGPAERVVAGLPDEAKVALIHEWRTDVPARAELSDAEILDSYARVIVEEVVERARLATCRRVNW